MNTLRLLILAATTVALPSFAATNIGVSIGINAPGQYGRIDINNYPQPVLVVTQPVVISPTPVAVYQRPVYLYVPQTHREQWGRYCGRYSACTQPVYFVQERWVHDEYRREHTKQGKTRGHGKSKGHGHGHNKHD